MKELKLINTEIGRIPVLIQKIEDNDKTYYEGSVLSEYNIFIQAETEEFCLEQLKKAFELSMHFWVRYELADLGLSYEGKVNKNWYNGKI